MAATAGQLVAGLKLSIAAPARKHYATGVPALTRMIDRVAHAPRTGQFSASAIFKKQPI
jgi:hypothetical protein